MTSRKDLAAALARGVAVELGVASGAFSQVILQQSAVARLYSIDRWSDHHDPGEYLRACERLATFGRRSIVLRLSFAEALPLFQDAFFDFIYIDGYAHLGQENGRTLHDWWPKLKPGGIYAGHDYHPGFPKTIQEVDAFSSACGLAIHLTQEPKFPSWWLCKPAAPAETAPRGISMHVPS